MYTKIEYLYRDAGNWKQYNEFIVSGALALSDLKPYLHDGEFFIPGELGLDNLFPVPFDEDDHPWHEILVITETSEPPTVSFDSKELISRFQKAAKYKWHESAWTEFGHGYGSIPSIRYTKEEQ